jgi:glycosyltransferase involved in cell wall biosynthesis
MNILLTVDPEIPLPCTGYGGIERMVYMLVEQYLAKGHEVTLCANAGSTVPCRLVGWKGKRSQDKWDIIRNTTQLTSVVFNGKFDVVHSFSRLAYIAPLLRSSVPKIMSYQREPTISQPLKAFKLAKKGSLIFTGCSDYITSQLSAVAEAYTVYNGAPMHVYQPTQKVAANAPLVFLGRVEPIKGPHIAIEVAQRTNKRLIIAGMVSSAYQGYFDEHIKPFLNERITFIGSVNDHEKNDLLGSALAFLMPIEWDEPFGIVMVEAMACGTPVLAFKRGSVPEVVEDGITGFICKNAEEMAEQVMNVHQLDRLKIRHAAETKFSDDEISNNYLQLYKKMIERKRKRRDTTSFSNI